jgi:hypothetical protein
MIRSLAFAALLATVTACTPNKAPTPGPFTLMPSVSEPQACRGDKPGFCPDPPIVATPSPYHRNAFGNGWAIVHGNCDTREVVLERDAGPAAVDTDGDGCRDDAPVRDLYTGHLVEPSHADADHVVALADAWNSGAWQWTPAQRRAFAQDQANLRAVGASINRAKGDRGPDTFRPPDRAGWCTYAQTYRATKQRWHLTITPAQNAAVNEMTKTCLGGTR